MMPNNAVNSGSEMQRVLGVRPKLLDTKVNHADP